MKKPNFTITNIDKTVFPSPITLEEIPNETFFYASVAETSPKALFLKLTSVSATKLIVFAANNTLGTYNGDISHLRFYSYQPLEVELRVKKQQEG